MELLTDGRIRQTRLHEAIDQCFVGSMGVRLSVVLRTDGLFFGIAVV
jgi:hypothetical protein